LLKKNAKMSTSNNAKEGFSLTIVVGAILVLSCLVLIAFNFGLLNPTIQSIVFSWPTLLILLAFIGFAKRNKVIPLLLLLVGVFFLIPRIEKIYPGILGEVDSNFISKYWRLLLIVGGLIFIIGMVASKIKDAYFTEDACS